ncbi:set domain-containing protein [Pyrenophora teres f. maculata]|nr:set domain-containing protein [Pyrenophora teres f. maculata]
MLVPLQQVHTVFRSFDRAWKEYGGTNGRSPNSFMLTPPDAAYQVVNTGNKGRGMVASFDIAAGEVILRKTPLVVVSHRQFMPPLLLLLPKRALEAILPLHNAMPYEKRFSAGLDIHYRLLDALVGCMSSNAFDGTFPCGLMGILVLAGSIFNHDSNFDAERNQLDFSATRNIAKGEELSVLYTNDSAALARYGI